MTDQVPPAFDSVDISSLAFWAMSPEARDERFAELRTLRPVSWQRPVDTALVESQIPGFWAVTTNELIREVSTNPEVFCSGEGTQLEEIPEDFRAVAESFLAMDGDEHIQMRKLVSSSFTPKQVKRIEEQIRQRATSIVDHLLEIGEGDFVENVSKQMPMTTFYDIVGLPARYRDDAAHNADGLASWNDPDVAAGREPGQVVSDSLLGNLSIGLEFSELTRKCPREDVWSNLVKARIDGRELSDDDLASIFVLMSFAGNDTTRTTISLGAKALLDHPEQLSHLLEDFDKLIDPAIDEVLRWVTPVMTFRRTATRDTVLGGRQIRRGDWVVMYYSSGNRDAEAFDDPWAFDITRKPNAHVAFGGGGPHFCLGSFLARMMLRHMYDQLFHRVPELTLGEPELLIGNFAGAVKRLPASTGCPLAH